MVTSFGSDVAVSSRGIVSAVQGRIPHKVRVWASLGSFCVSPATAEAAGVFTKCPREGRKNENGGGG